MGNCPLFYSAFSENNLKFLNNLGGRFVYFPFFLLFRGRGKEGGVRGEKRGGLYWEIERGGGEGFQEGRRGGTHRSWECVAGKGGGAKFFLNLFFSKIGDKLN